MIYGPLSLAVSDLSEVIPRLRPEQTDGRRRAARALVKSRIRKVLEALDKEYPAPARKTPTKRRRSDNAKLSNWTRVAEPGVVSPESYAALGAAARLGIRSRSTRCYSGGTYTWLPTWLVEALRSKLSDIRIKELKKSQKARKVFMVQCQLQKLHEVKPSPSF